MQKVLRIVAVIILSYLTTDLFSQSQFTNCSAIFLDDQLVVDNYSPEGKCRLPESADGQMTVCASTYDNDKWHCTEKIAFKIAIKDGNTKTLWSFSNATYKEIDFKKVLAKCKKGDYVVILTTKNEYALPHNEILIE